ncbi:DUF2970 domain-containing protein [Variovorax dokdonensis]|uniref:DUF2970 domain-containing protein n=1 Tax=Variovorax dokdonensis TaxID=344883 RepID=A0ABT7N5I5_9BURK|nr:DUF2970 domain-containing protein [Variovorax dokdonensis]MDM0043180.1 DUF2970 domain-containing protein [Variovorax dokdonensis]
MTKPAAPPQDQAGAEPARPSLARTIKAVAWGFFGVRKNSAYEEDIRRLTPLHVVGVGLVAVVLLVLGLVALVKFVVAP